MKRKTFTKSEVSKMLQINPRRIQWWTEAGIVTPSIDDAKGKGTRRKYSANDVLKFHLAQMLSQKSVALKIIKDLLDWKDERGIYNPFDMNENLRDVQGISKPAQLYLAFISGNWTMFLTTNALIEAVKNGFEDMYLIDLEKAKREVRSRMKS